MEKLKVYYGWAKIGNVRKNVLCLSCSRTKYRAAGVIEDKDA